MIRKNIATDPAQAAVQTLHIVPWPRVWDQGFSLNETSAVFPAIVGMTSSKPWSRAHLVCVRFKIKKLHFLKVVPHGLILPVLGPVAITKENIGISFSHEGLSKMAEE